MQVLEAHPKKKNCAYYPENPLKSAFPIVRDHAQVVNLRPHPDIYVHPD